MEKQNKLSNIIDYYEKRLEDSTDNRPTTGMVGQHCLGFVQDSKGKLIRIIPEIKGEEYIGPGSYNPEKPKNNRKAAKISSNSKRTNFIKKDTTKLGPQSYNCNLPKSTKYQHQLRNNDRSPHIEPFKSGNQEHKAWVGNSPKNLPRRRFPATHFRENTPSSFFASKQKRELFPVPPDETEPKFVPYQRPTTEGCSSAVFKNQIPRTFDDPTTMSPAPCTYTLPETIGREPKTHDMSPSWVDINSKKDKEFFSSKINTPGPGYYDTEEKKKKRPMNPVFANKIPRYRAFEYDDSKPTPCTYEVTKQNDKKIPITLTTTGKTHELSWNRTTYDEIPGPGSYSPTSSNHKKAVQIKGHSNVSYLTPQEDHSYAFRTAHSSLIKRTYNSRYYHVNKNLV